MLRAVACAYGSCLPAGMAVPPSAYERPCVAPQQPQTFWWTTPPNKPDSVTTVGEEGTVRVLTTNGGA